MTTLPKAAIDAVMKRFALLGLNSDTAEAIVLAALPHLGDPVAWRIRPHEGMPYIAFTDDPIRDEYDGRGLELDALYLAPPAPAVSIKPLVWSWEPPFSVARVLGGHYAVEKWEEPEGHVDLIGTFIVKRDGFKTIEAAKAAAQDDYEARIRSALVDAPTPDHSGDVTNMIPAGRKSVPTKATKQIVAIMREYETGQRQGTPYDAWEDMLAATPEPPVHIADPATSPGHTDLLVDPATLDAFVEENPPGGNVVEQMAETLGECSCPRPANGRPYDFTAKECRDAGECGCSIGAALTSYEASRG